MWKVLVVICTLSHPCTMFDEDPVKWYKSEQECLAVANEKALGMTKTLEDNGHHIESVATTCQFLWQNDSA